MSDPYELVANEFDFMEGSDFRTACEHLGLKLIQAQIGLDNKDLYDVVIKELIKQDTFDLKVVCETLGLKLVPIEKDRGDGRKAHYGTGKQPVDTIREHGWAPGFFAGNVVKYLRRTKDPEHSLESALVYYKWLCDECRKTDSDDYQKALIKLLDELTLEELEKVKVL